MISGGVRRAIRSAALRWFPAVSTTLLSVRSRRLSQRLVERWGIRRVTDRIVAEQGLTVSSGPFEGLILPAGSRSEHLAPYLLGTYESEIHPWLEEVRRRSISRVIDVGAKFGYYAVGLARWFPEAECLAFDTDPWARRMMRVAASQNGVRNLTICGYLKPGEISRYVVPSTFILSDCEGFESRLFEGVPNGALDTAWILVELHEEAAPGVRGLLERRFAPTHELEVVGRTDRVPPERVIELLGIDSASVAVREYRGEQSWLFGRPRSAATT
jgi:hypothetical protein